VKVLELAVTDIGVSMRGEVLEHKKRDGKRVMNCYCYWTMPNGIPDTVGGSSRLWVASGGRWRGYFVIHAVDTNRHSGPEVQFYSESWVERDGGERKPFQGFTYEVPDQRDKERES
jgi:hypothetical protein